MKLALVVPGGVDRSGEYRVIPALLALIRRLSVAHDVHVFAFAQESVRGTWQLAGATVHNIGNPRAVARLVLAMLREHHRSRFSLVQSVWVGVSGLSAVVAANLMRVPACVHIAGGELAALPSIGYGGHLRRHWRMLDGYTLRSAARVTAASAPILAAAANLGIVATRVPLGVDLSVWPPRAPRARVPGELPRLVHVASLNRVKDQSTLLEALRLLKERGQEFHLDVVGEDTLGGRIQALTRQLGLGPHTTFHGFLRQAELRALVLRADVNVVSSLHEAGPLVVLEAAVAGVPTVGSAVGHIAEWAPHAAVAVAPGAPALLAAALGALLADEERRLLIAREAQRLAVAECADYTAARFESIYAGLVTAHQ